MLWDYGRMSEAADGEKAAQAFRELLKQEPARVDVRIELASVQLRSHAAKDALDTLAPVKTVTPQDAPRLLTLIAYANLEAGDREKARVAAEQLKRVSTKPEDRAQADRALEYLERLRTAAAQPTRVFQPADAPPVSRPTVKRPSATGKFVEFVCGDDLKAIVETAEGKKRFLIEDPEKLLVNGASGETRDLSCGPQKPVQIRVEYDPPGADNPGIDGLLRVIHFEP